MKIIKILLRAADRLLGAATIVLFILCLAIAVWSVADIAGIYHSASSEDYEALKPPIESVATDSGDSSPEPDGGTPAADFTALLAINPDVAGWITLPGTGIDYPILHGDSNSEYINTDLYGNYTLSGSIFLDYRSSRELTDTLSVLHGHHMQGGAMFGDLDLYTDQAFLDSSHFGTLCTPGGGAQEIELIACISVSAYDLRIFGKPESYTDAAAILDDLLYGEGTRLIAYRSPSLPIESDSKLLALATCSPDALNDRTVVIGVIRN